MVILLQEHLPLTVRDPSEKLQSPLPMGHCTNRHSIYSQQHSPEKLSCSDIMTTVATTTDSSLPTDTTNTSTDTNTDTTTDTPTDTNTGTPTDCPHGELKLQLSTSTSKGTKTNMERVCSDENMGLINEQNFEALIYPFPMGNPQLDSLAWSGFNLSGSNVQFANGQMTLPDILVNIFSGITGITDQQDTEKCCIWSALKIPQLQDCNEYHRVLCVSSAAPCNQPAVEADHQLSRTS
ncbi:hypothetical protein Pcinc_015601 [Petrolisthes cinctipes]|uniref:Uncharacterized protein n=1 Tax=Petrolisthes cinctipes TaxID=88211 RepID=A0AAE1FUI9_PETCI|nr:hypothetical protein Pcinc_015601 [Petrolisthes cinctipes]